MKVKDIVGEGVISSFASGMLPQTMQNVLSSIKKPVAASTDTDLDVAQAAFKKFGAAPPRPEDSPYGYTTGELAWLTDEQLKARIEAAKQNKQVAKELAKQTKQAARKGAQQQPSMIPDLPSVSAASIPKGHRIAVQNPQRTATFYKYSDGRWTDEFGNVMPSASHGALEQFADTAGRMEPTPTKGISGFKPRGSRRAK